MGWPRKVVRFSAVILAVAGCAFLVVLVVGEGLATAGTWAGLLGGVAGIVGAVAAVWPLTASRSQMWPLPLMGLPAWVVDRPAEVAAAAAAVAGGDATTGGSTTALQGAGGFGKTTLARMVCAEPSVRRRFDDRVYWVTLGRDALEPAAIAAKVNDVIKAVSGEDAAFTDPEIAGRWLGALLEDAPWRLLVLDDVWESGQLTPFIQAGKHCARLVTTRVPGLVDGPEVRVEQMSADEARILLEAGLPPLSSSSLASLLGATGRWPLLLRLVNKIIANAARTGIDVSTSAEQLLELLHTGGPASVDDLSSSGGAGLDVSRPETRAQAVGATIRASTSALEPRDMQRLAELGVFARHETVPFHLIASLWRYTGGLTELRASQLVIRLRDLALISGNGTDGLELHDVIGDYLRAELGPLRLAEVNSQLVDLVASELPRVQSLHAGQAAPRTAWWELRSGERYLLGQLIRHLIDSGRQAEAEATAGDLRWISLRLRVSGPAAPVTDLIRVGTPFAMRLRAVLEQAAHLLASTDPPDTVIDILWSRVAQDGHWEEQVKALQADCRRPRLVTCHPLPDLPDPALNRVMTEDNAGSIEVAIAPDGAWLAASAGDTVRIWDTSTWQQCAALPGQNTHAVAIAPDGAWLAASAGDTVRIWDTSTWQQHAAMPVRDSAAALAIAPDGTWLAVGGFDDTVRILDSVTGQERAVLPGHAAHSAADVAIAPDGAWLAASAGDTVLIWDTASWRQRTVLTCHSTVSAVAIAPDGTWLAVGDLSQMGIWDTGSWKERETRADAVCAAAVAPDGSWLAAGGFAGMLRVWSTDTWREQIAVQGHATAVRSIAIAPSSTWLASSDFEGNLRIWDASAWRQRVPGPGLAAAAGTAPDVAEFRSPKVNAVATAPDGTWLVAGGQDGIIQVRDAVTGRELADLPRHGTVDAIAVSPDGSLVAIASSDLASGAVRIWDAANWQQRASLPWDDTVAAVAFAPDGTWLATGGWDKGIRIWDAVTWQERTSLSAQGKSPVTSMAIAPDGTWLAVSGYFSSLLIWDTATWQSRVRQRGPVPAVAIAPDGSWLAAAEGTVVRIWNTATWQERASLADNGDGSVSAVAVAPGGGWLAAAKGNTVRIWNTVTWQVVTLMRVDGAITSLAWLGGSQLAFAGSGGLYLFRLLSMPSSAASDAT